MLFRLRDRVMRVNYIFRREGDAYACNGSRNLSE